MVAFSRQDTKTLAIQVKIRRAKTQARGQHPDMKLKHPDWCRDANDGKYTIMIKKITEDTVKEQLKVEKFRSKLHAKI